MLRASLQGQPSYLWLLVFLDVKMDSCLSYLFPSLMKALIFHSVLLFCGLDLIIVLDHLFLQATLGLLSLAWVSVAKE